MAMRDIKTTEMSINKPHGDLASTVFMFVAIVFRLLLMLLLLFLLQFFTQSLSLSLFLLKECGVQYSCATQMRQCVSIHTSTCMI